MKNFQEIIDTIMELKGFSKEARVGELLGLTSSSIANFKARDSVPLNKIVIFCEQEGLSLDHVLLGKSPYEQPSQNGIDIESNELLLKTRDIIDSDTEYAASLTANIRSFYSAITTAKAEIEAREQLKELESRLEAKRLRDLEELETKLEARFQKRLAATVTEVTKALREGSQEASERSDGKVKARSPASSES